MELFIDNRQEIVEIDEELMYLLEYAIKEVLAFENKKGNYEISISIVDNKEIKELNKQFRGMDEATDVLSFPTESENLNLPIILLGDIIISAEQALAQSKVYGHSFKREMVYLTVHSMFHLLGYDHIDIRDKKIMRDKEKALLKKIKIFRSEDKQ